MRQGLEDLAGFFLYKVGDHIFMFLFIGLKMSLLDYSDNFSLLPSLCLAMKTSKSTLGQTDFPGKKDILFINV